MRRMISPINLSVFFFLLTCLGAALYAFNAHRSNAQVINEHLEALADQTISELQTRFRLYEYGLRGARGAVVAVGQNNLTHDVFARYAESRDVKHEFPGARGFGFIGRVPREKLASFVEQARIDRHSDFTIREFAPHAGDSFVIKYIEPEQLSTVAIGLDIASETNRREAALASMESGKATLTGPITLVQMTGIKNRSMLFLLPVYEGSQTRDPNSRGAALVGWAYTPLVTDEILADFNTRHPSFGFTLIDQSDPAHPAEIFSSTRATTAKGILTRFRDFAIYGRQWRVVIEAKPAFLKTLDLIEPAWGAAWIATTGALLGAVMFVLLSARERKQRTLAQTARLATIVQDSHDAIIGTSLDGIVTEWNNAATQYFGYSATEAIGHSIVSLIVPERYIDEDRDILRRAYAGEKIALSESVRQHRDGSTLYVEISASPIRDGKGRVVGAAKSMRDITERIKAQKSVLELNASLEKQVQQRTAELQSFSALQRAILANAGYAIIATDPEGIITLFNPAAETMLGYREEELVGRASPNIFHEPIEMVKRAATLEAELGRHYEPVFEIFVAKARDRSDVNEWTYVRKDGARLPVLLNVSTLRSEEGEIQGYLGIAVDLIERKRREAALEVNERKLRGLFELSPLGIALTNETGRLIDFNEAFRSLTGYSEEELRDMDYWTLTPQEYLVQEHAILKVIEHTGRYGPYDKHYVRKDGSRVPVRLNGVVLRIGNNPHIWSIVEDTTTQRLAEEAMINAVAAAEAASKAKSDFLANMSHEIRTPMNAILGMLQLLQRTSLGAKQHDYAKKTETAATTLLLLLNDILDFSKIEAGRQTLESHDFDMDKLLREIAVILSANVGAKDLEVIFEIDDRIPKWLIGDSLRLQQILINLAGNAVKFTQEGEVVLSAKLTTQSERHVGVCFEVRDTGIGIAPEKLTSIFEGFSQAEASTTRRYGGSGLGLAICQRLVALMGGALQVESTLGVGSRFFFTIELEASESRVLSATLSVMQRLHNLRALVVDDSENAREAIVEMARSLGWVCDSAAGGQEALDRMVKVESQDQAYDVILMDWNMPGMDGWETCQRIRKLDAFGQLPLIVMVTMYDREMVVERQSQANSTVDGFLIKPVTASMLLDAVADALVARGTGAQPPAQVAPAYDGSNRLSGLRFLVVEDNLTNQQVAKDLLESEGAQVDVANGGNEALHLLIEKAIIYNAVLMDIQMPDMDGYTATRRIRASHSSKRIPIIAMTANVLASDREACLAAGMDDHIGKPFDFNALVKCLLHWTGRQVDQSINVPYEEGATQDGTGSSDANLDAESALLRFGGRRQAYANALGAFSESVPSLVHDIEEAIRKNQKDIVARVLHTLKGNAATVGANRLAAGAASLERELRRDTIPWQEVVALNHLRKLVENAVTVSQIALTRFADTAADDVKATPLTKAIVQEMATQLESSNLRAIELFEHAEAQIAIHDPDAHKRMKAAFNELDLRKALTVCREILLKMTGNQA